VCCNLRHLGGTAEEAKPRKELKEETMRAYLIRLLLPRFAVVLCAPVLFASVARASQIQTETFVPVKIDYPGSTSTVARGINNPGNVVGTYFCAAACVNPLTGETSAAGTHGFLLQDGVFTRVDVPGGTATVARGISEQGVIVGHYNVGAVTHGFAYLHGIYINPIDVPADDFDHPSSTLRDTLPVRISPQGDIVGCFHEDSQTMTTMHGWLLRQGTFTVLKTDQATNSHDPDTMNNGIAPTGEIAGFYLSSGVSYIADENGIVITFTVPDNLFTLAWDVNAKGDVVGVYGSNQSGSVGAAINPSGFLRTKDGDYLGLKVQGASITQIFGINSLRCIVGQFTDSTGTHGFVYRLKEGNQ